LMPIQADLICKLHFQQVTLLEKVYKEREYGY